MGNSNNRNFDPGEVDTLLETGGGLIDDMNSGRYVAEDVTSRWIGAQLGPWKITGFLDRGGMSLVFRGERSDGQFDMQVAIKIIQRSATSDLASRFERERRILASLQHPNICRILDGGATEGQPWLVMELVEGTAIDLYCDSHHLTLRQRLRLLEQVCEAVRAAHRQLVVHRDIKPGNILVTDEGHARLLDFGIARILAAEGSDLATQSPYLTPRFATPEMLTGEPINVASDIYQIGLLLHLLLVGRHAQDIEAGNLAQITATILEISPASPSQALDTTSRENQQAAQALAEVRSSRLERLQRDLKGDLDAIVGTCLRKQPENRYASVDALLGDLRAWREQRPVAARVPSRPYRLRRFVQRHRGGVGASMLTLLVLFGSLIAVTVSWRGTLLAQRQAEQEAARAKQVTELLTSTLEGADPDQSLGQEITVLEMLEQTSRQASTLLVNQPTTEASLRQLIGKLFLRLGRLQKSRNELALALKLQRGTVPKQPEKIASIRTDLARTLLDLGEAKLARQHANSAWQSRRDELGAEDTRSLESRLLVANIDQTLGDNEGALKVTKSVVRSLRASGSDRDLLINSLGQLAAIEVHLTDYPAARKSIEEAIALQRQLLSQPNMRLAALLHKQAGILTYLGEASALLPAEEAVAITREIMGEDHPLTAQALISRASYSSQTFEFEAALNDLEEAMDIVRNRVGENHELMGTLYNNLAVVRFRQERFREASDYYSRSMAVYLTLFGEDHPIFLSTALYRAYGWHLAGDPRAESAYRELIPHLTEVRGPAHLHTSHAHADLGRLLLESGRDAEAVPHLRKALAIRKEILGDGGVQMIADNRLYLGAALSETGQLEEGGHLIQQGLQTRQQRRIKEESKRTILAEADLYLARHEFRLGNTEPAHARLLDATTVVRELKPEGHWLRRLADQVKSSMSETNT